MINVLQDFNKNIFSDDAEEVGIGGFTTYCNLSEKITRKATAPYYFVEDGSAIADHVVLDPVIINIAGIVAKKFTENSILSEFQSIGDSALGLTNNFNLPLSSTAKKKSDQILSDVFALNNQINNTINQTQLIYSQLINPDAVDDLPKIFDETMASIFQNKIMINVQTRNKNYKNMIISSLVTSFDNKIDHLTFEMELVQIRIAETQSQLFDNASSGIFGQSQGVSDKGDQVPEKVTDSSLLGFLLGN